MQTFKKPVFEVKGKMSDGEKERKHCTSMLIFLLRVINHNIDTSNNSGWKNKWEKKKIKKIKGRQEQLSEKYPEHSVLKHQHSALPEP